jgi:hypothetical protein
MFKNQNATLHFTNEKSEGRFLKYYREENILMVVMQGV